MSVVSARTVRFVSDCASQLCGYHLTTNIQSYSCRRTELPHANTVRCCLRAKRLALLIELTKSNIQEGLVVQQMFLLRLLESSFKKPNQTIEPFLKMVSSLYKNTVLHGITQIVILILCVNELLQVVIF